MEKRTHYPYIEKVKSELDDRHDELEKQLKKVGEEYPLVALAYHMARWEIADVQLAFLAVPGTLAHEFTALDGETLGAAARRAAEESAKKWRDLEVCLERAQTDAETAACFGT